MDLAVRFLCIDERLIISFLPVSQLRSESPSKTPSVARVPIFRQGICLRSTRTRGCQRFAAGSACQGRFAASFCEFFRTNLPTSVHSNYSKTLLPSAEATIRRLRGQPHGIPCILFDTAPRPVSPGPRYTRRPRQTAIPSQLILEHKPVYVWLQSLPSKCMRLTQSRFSHRDPVHSPAEGNVYAMYSPE
jgi:hypothetical protein